jgi:hypothetical protein
MMAEASWNRRYSVCGGGEKGLYNQQAFGHSLNLDDH